MGQLPIMFFIPGRVAQKSLASDPVPPDLRAFRRLSLRSSLLQARRSGSVRLCSHTRPGLLAHCSPLLAARQANLFAYVQAPRLIWMTKQEILGANYGMDIIVPFAYKDVNAAFGIDQQLNLADLQVEPVLFSWHRQQFDFSAGYAVWAPSGHFDTSTPVKQLTSPGSGFWSHMLTLGAVWHPDEQKTWSLSLLGRYELCHEQQDTHVTPGNMGTLEWGVSKSVAQGVDVGVVGYYQQQITKDSGVGASTEHSRVVGVGPEISVFWQKPALFTSLRYEYEAVAKDRPKGNTIVLTLTKPF